jgi:hypothetical protein
MKYKCTDKYSENNNVIMNPYDIVVLDDDSNQMYNITTGCDYIVKNLSKAKLCLEDIVDEQKVSYPTPESHFRTIIESMIDTFIRKNHDYGNSFEESLNEEGIAAARIRMGDKWNRFKALSKGKHVKVNDESIRDTLLDLANYCVMTAMWLDNGNVQNL